MERHCLECGDVLHGRTDKKFCCDACRNTYNNKRKSTAGISMIRRINGTLIRNRNILAELNPDGKTSVHRVKMINRGFDFGFITHLYTTRAGKVYYFCYDQGYLPLEHDYFMLVSRSGDS